MHVSVFGLGYVGCVQSACLAQMGHTVLAVDINHAKVDCINAGQSPVVEPGLADLISQGVDNGRLRAYTTAALAVQQSDLSLICVGTPSSDNGSVDLGAIEHVCHQIGDAMAAKHTYHAVAVRSTLPPGTSRHVVAPLLEQASGRRLGATLGICHNPEFMREGNGIEDYHSPPFTLIGETDERAGDLLSGLYRPISAPLLRVDLETAEMVKYVNNAFHALKVTFANEIGVLCKSLGIDSHRVMEIFVQDRKLNISPAYLKPGYAFGGSCLPKDLRALLHMAEDANLDVPVLAAIRSSNDHHAQRALEMVLQTGRRRVGIIGLSFKPDTDDLRESPLVSLVRALIRAELDVKIYDPALISDHLLGTNQAYAAQVLQNLGELLCPSLDDLVAHAEVLVIGHRYPGIAELVRRERDRIFVDLVRVDADPGSAQENCIGIAW